MKVAGWCLMILGVSFLPAINAGAQMLYGNTDYVRDSVVQPLSYDRNEAPLVDFDANTGTAGLGRGTGGYINVVSTSTPIFEVLLHTRAYNNYFMNMTSDQEGAADLRDLAGSAGALRTPVTAVVATPPGETSNDLLIYPNPVEAQTYIDLGVASIDNVYAEVIDLNGNVLRTYQYIPGSQVLQVDMSKLPRGVYSVRVYGKGIGGHNLKVVKE